MGIEKLLATDSTKGCFQTNTQTNNVDIPVTAGEFLSPQDLMEKIVMKLLKTTDVEKAKNFISTVDLSAEKEPVRTEKDGQFFYRFEPSENLKKIINLYTTANTNIFTSNENTKVLENSPKKTPVNFSQTHQNQLSNGLQTSLIKNRVLSQLHVKSSKMSADPKVINPQITQRKQSGSSDWIPVELNPKDFIKLVGKKGHETAVVTVGDKDPRQEILETAFRKLYGGRIGDDVINEYLQSRNDKNAMWTKVEKGQEQKVISFEKAIAGLETALKKGEPYFFSIHRSDTENLQRLQIEKHGSEEDKLNLKIQDKLKAIDEEFDKINIQNNLQRAVIELSRQNAKRDAIDALVSQSKADFRSPTEEGNSIADAFEKTVRFLVDSHPIYRLLDQSVKQQIVNFGVGIGKGAAELAGAATGYTNFFRDVITDIAIEGAERTGIDVSKLKTAVQISRQNERKTWERILNARTAEMARGDFGYQAKKDNGIRTTVYDTPNWVVNAGDMTAQALPFLIIGLATGGASIGAQIAVTGATGAAQKAGSVYIRTQNKASAVFAAAIGAAQGAAGPISAKLPFPADVAANAALGYIVAKVENPNADDAQIMQSIIMQTAQGGAFKIGSELHQRLSQKAGSPLSETELKKAYEQEVKENLSIIKEESAKSSGEQVKNVVESLQKEAASQSKTKQTELEAKNTQEALGSPEARKLNQIRERLSDAAKVEFDVMRKTQKSDTKFLEMLSRKGDVTKMFESIARRNAEQPAKLNLEKEILDKARLQVGSPEFVNKPLVNDALNAPKAARLEFISEQISIEIVKSKLESQYPKSQGYEMQTGVNIYKDSGYTTIVEWLKDHPTIQNAEKFLIEQNGKVWQLETDMDIAVVKRNVNGKLEIVRTEEVKSGGKNASIKAREQVEKVQNALEQIRNGDASVKIFYKKSDVTAGYEVGKNIKSVTRGTDDKANFDESIGLTSKQIDQLATELVNKYRKGGK